VTRRILSLLFFVACSNPATASADWLLSPYIGVRFASDTTFVIGSLETDRNKVTFGSSIGLLTDGVFGVEADVAFVPGFFDGANINGSGRVVTVMGNVILAVPLGVTQYGLRPYFVGGAGLLNADVGSIRLEIDNSRLFGMNLGGGALGPLTNRTSLRVDVRYFKNLSHDEEATDLAGDPADLSFWRATVGLSFRF
jgi:opacity protein-like surface antigen